MAAMLRNKWRWFAAATVVKLCLTGLIFALAAPPGRSATPTAEQALKLTPMQKDVDCDRPTPEEAARCTMKAEKHKGQTGWVIRDGDGRMLREFVDTNGDNIVDRWSYFKDGVEVYRDIDPKFTGKATEHRWLNTAGSRWGVSKGGSTPIEYWKMISAEEVSAEVVGALRDRDPARFNRLLLTQAELRSLGLNAAKTKELEDKLSAAPSAFAELADRQTTVTAKSNWVHFGGNRPGTVPAGTFGAPADIEVYENVVAVVETDGNDAQVQIGTMIKAGDCWRIVDVPGVPEHGKLADSQPGIFFVAPAVHNTATQETASSGGDAKIQKVMDELQKLDQQITAAASPQAQAKLNDERADFLEQVIAEVGPAERAQWIRQMTDTISAAVQSATYPKGAERLKALYTKLEKNPQDGDLAAYVEFRELSAEYALALQGPNPEFAKIQTTWLQNLETFVGRHPKSPDTADALLQLGIAQEFAGQDDKAKQWYRQIVGDFDSTAAAKKAAGAIRRLESVGKTIELSGKSIDGEQVDLGSLKGKFVLIHYWATWCEPCKVDLASLKELQAKYATSGLAIIGVSLDANRPALDDYLSKNHLPWPQLFEPGGLDSRYANEMGILTLPTMILVDAEGHVANRGIHISELDNELRTRLK
jgi:thiol-disulfide isomerase/thioredoxin